MRGSRAYLLGGPETPAAMASLLAKDAYLQGLARKICSRPSPEPQTRKSGKAQPGVGPGRTRGGERPCGCPPHRTPQPSCG